MSDSVKVHRRFRNRFIYLINLSLIFIHTMLSIYLSEWKLLNIPGGEAAYLIVLTALLMLAVWGMLLLHDRLRAGLYFAVGMGVFGIAHAAYHVYGLAINSNEPIFSLILVGATLVMSGVQLYMGVRTLTPRKHRRVSHAEMQLGLEAEPAAD